MLWFLALVFGVWALGCLFDKATVLFKAAREDRDQRTALEELYRRETLRELRVLTKAVSEPPPPPLRARLREAGRDVKRRRELDLAMERELGIK